MLIKNQNISERSVFDWIEAELEPIFCTSEEFIYNDMESQSDYSLPIIYQSFDPTKKSHWTDRGDLYDFLYSTKGEGKKLLDFGPGDGWPSLIVAPYVKEVIGLDSSEKRVRVCTGNAKRMGTNNASFTSYISGTKLPFEDNCFDGIMAASSVEQTPDPKKTIEKLYRVLKPGGRIRISYEALNDYKDGYEKDLWISDLSEESCKLILFNRDLKNEYVLQYGLTIAMSEEKFENKLSSDNNVIFDQVTVSFLEEIRAIITNVQACKTIHPSGKTLAAWLKEAGFKEILPTYSGRAAAAKLFNQYSDDNRPDNLDSVDEVIKKVVKIVTELEAPLDIDPMITAIK
ncbi:class I SAM-dependent methyltransferase [Proteiniborus sp. MB09-C3]|uniref:class I SAM-dependent methyltransferase n=1 Tax=Proteiniborus sp. MB09-C3 TaxID=3050072 RepID=UPI0025535148|nr:class I SAM-dependent methyltransferase [Proteiniborus sp. MB09-C3]WIV12868.1 class I SAM-dependent methyltransferase [Proteiniborus sp. MB09-C3]